MRRGTYSIVARDAASGEIGVAVQSHWFSVGPIVPWARAGVGAVATQSIAEPAYGPRLLERARRGRGAGAALEALLADDEQARATARWRSRCARRATRAHRRALHRSRGRRRGEGFSAQANMMASPEVWPAMARATRARTGPLARRLLAALLGRRGRRRRRAWAPVGGAARGAGRRARRGRPSATCASRTTPTRSTSCAACSTSRTPTSSRPRATTLTGEGDHAEAGERYERASALAPGNAELLFWAGLGAAQAGAMDVALERVRRRSRSARSGASCSIASSRTSRRAPPPSAPRSATDPAGVADGPATRGPATPFPPA